MGAVMFKKIVPNFHDQPEADNDRIYRPAMGQSLNRAAHLARLENIQQRLSNQEAAFSRTVGMLQQSINQRRDNFRASYHPLSEAFEDTDRRPSESVSTEDIAEQGASPQTEAEKPPTESEAAPAQMDNRRATIVPVPPVPAETRENPAIEKNPITSEPVLRAPAPSLEMDRKIAPAHPGRKSRLKRLLPRGLFDLKPLFSSHKPTANRKQVKEIN